MIAIPEVRFGADGLCPVVLQDALTGEVLTLAYADAEALRRTAESGQTWLWSRSRRELWNKGATSGNTQRVVQIAVDCDGDALIYRVLPEGPACHTGARACWDGVGPTLLALDDTIAARAAGNADGSYTAALLADENKRLKKLGEEALELALACARGPDAEVANEAADVLYHVLVAVRGRGLGLRDVLAVLESRRR